jgi:virginiamycin A acetyltransferase
MIPTASLISPPAGTSAGPHRERAPLSAGVLLRWAAKSLFNGVGLAMTAAPGFACRLESWATGRDELFLLCGQALALAPGLPGKYLRKCFYYWTLESASLSCDIGFLSHFSDRRVTVGAHVYIGLGLSVGTATLGEGCLIGNRVSIINGGRQHHFGADGRLTPFDRSAAPRICIGAETWIGEGAILMADVGSRCIVAAGAVVSSAVPNECIVGGNPARFVGKVTIDGAAPSPQRNGP